MTKAIFVILALSAIVSTTCGAPADVTDDDASGLVDIRNLHSLLPGMKFCYQYLLHVLISF